MVAAHKQKQFAAWKFQSLISNAIFIPSLIIVTILVNFHKGFVYDEGAVLDNQELTMAVVFSTSMGLISLALSFKPDIIKSFRET